MKPIVLAAALAACACTKAPTPLPEARMEGRTLSVDGLAEVTVPSESSTDVGIEGPAQVWQGRGWEIRYSLVPATERDPIDGRADLRECDAIPFEGALDTIAVVSSETKTFETRETGQLTLQILADNISACRQLQRDLRPLD